MRSVSWVGLLLSAWAQTCCIADTALHHTVAKSPVVPVIAIIIDDIGNRGPEGVRAVLLPGPIAFAVLPHTPHGRNLADYAHANGKEVLLHLPLEAVESNELLGRGAIMMDDSAVTVAQVLRDNLQAVPHVVGINNHMGSLLTRHPGHMRWLMQAIRDDGGLFFIDSVTTGQSVAYAIASDYALPTARRDIFLDTEQNHRFIRGQFELLKQRALTRGYAIAIGHPFPETLDVLEAQLPKLAMAGIRLISVRDMIRRQRGNYLEETVAPMPVIQASPAPRPIPGVGAPGLLQQEAK